MAREAAMGPHGVAVGGVAPRRRPVAAFLASTRSDWIVLVVLAALWQLLASAGAIRANAFPAPLVILRTLVADLVGPGHPLVGATLHTFALTLAGYAVSVAIGVPIGFLMGRNGDVRAALNPLVALALPLPAVVTIPVLTLWIPNPSLIVVLVVAFAAGPPLMKAAELGARSVGRVHLWAAASVGAAPWWIWRHVVLPGSLGHVLPAMRVAMGYAWRAVVAAEFITLLQPGLGTSIFAARQFNDVPLMCAGLILIGLIGYGLERGVLGTIEARTLRRWGLLVR